VAERAFELLEHDAWAQALLDADLLDVSRIVSGNLKNSVDLPTVIAGSLSMESGSRATSRVEVAIECRIKNRYGMCHVDDQRERCYTLNESS